MFISFNMLSLVLFRRDFREFDQIISLYTKEKGKIAVLARGVKKITSKNSAHLEPFSLVDAEIILGKELARLGAVQPINYFVNIRQDLQKSLAAGYVVSFLDKVLHEGEKDERLFSATLNFLEHLNLQSTICSLQLLDDYIVKLLHCLGYDIQAVKADPDHDFIYKFLVFHLERKVGDWGKMFGK